MLPDANGEMVPGSPSPSGHSVDGFHVVGCQHFEGTDGTLVVAAAFAGHFPDFLVGDVAVDEFPDVDDALRGGQA